VTGDSIGNYIRGRRLSQAYDDLKKFKNRKILDTAFKFQFASQESFARAFKKNLTLRLGKYGINKKFFQL